MSGPCSFPDGDKSRWEELNEIVCDVHFHCWPGKGDSKQFKPCDLITLREWPYRRNRLHTGKTV